MARRFVKEARLFKGINTLAYNGFDAINSYFRIINLAQGQCHRRLKEYISTLRLLYNISDNGIYLLF